MNPDDIARALEEVRPQTPETQGWGARVRRRNRSRRLGGVAALGASLVAAVAALAMFTQPWQPVSRTTPVPASTPTASFQQPVEELEACAARVRYVETVATIEEAVQAAFCGPASEGEDSEYVQVPLPDELVARIVAQITAVDTHWGIQPGLNPVLRTPSLVLVNAHGETITLVGEPLRGFSWYPPPGTGGLHHWTPDPAMTAQMMAEITRDGACTAPTSMTTGDVEVHVYDAGGGADAIAEVIGHLEKAGFLVRDTREKATKTLGGPIVLRGGGSEKATGGSLVSSWFAPSVGAEMSRDDGLVDVLVTDEFTSDALQEGKREMPDGGVTC